MLMLPSEEKMPALATICQNFALVIVARKKGAYSGVPHMLPSSTRDGIRKP